MIDFDNLFDVRIKHYFHHYTILPTYSMSSSLMVFPLSRIMISTILMLVLRQSICLIKRLSYAIGITLF